jgi:hypothetical protein
MRTRSNVTTASAGMASASSSPSPTVTTITGTASLREKNRARRCTPHTVPSTPSSTLAPAMPRACKPATTSRWSMPRPR